MAYSLKYSYDSTSQSYSVTGYSNITESDNVVIPPKYDDRTNGEHSVTTIGTNAFKNCTSLTRITISSPVLSIGGDAFAGCTSLTSVTIPYSIKFIEQGAFYNCTSLKRIDIPSSVTSIGQYAFSGCTSLTGVYITDIAAWCNISFSSSSSNPLHYAHKLYLNNELVKELVIPNSVTSIGYSAFSGCTSLTSMTIPDSVTSIGNDAFNNCTNLTSVTIGNGVKRIGSEAFYGCNRLTSIIIPDSTTTIGEDAFAFCENLINITIPDSITIINKGVFYNCTRLTSVTIPDSVTSIGQYAFSGCISLKTIILFPETPPTLGSTGAIPTTTTIYVQQSSKESYKTATNWTAFASKIESNNTYLSLIRFNQRNKEYIDEKILEATQALLARITALENK